MARYIDADKLIESTIVKFKCVPLVGVTNYIYGEECFGGEHLDTLINEQPTADVVEVKHGEWLYNVKYYSCSICAGKRFNLLLGTDAEFCPHCGAKMDGESVTDNA